MADRPEPPQAPAVGLDVDLEVTNESIRLRFRCNTGVAVLLGVTGVTLGALYGKEKIQPVIESLFQSVFGFCKIKTGSIVVDVDCFSAKRVKELLNDYKCGKLKRRFVEELRKIDGEVENLRINFELKETLEVNTNRKSRDEKQSEKTGERTAGMSEQEYLETLESIEKLDGETERLIELAQNWSYRNINFEHDLTYKRELERSDEHGRTISHYAAVVRNEYLLAHLRDLSLFSFNAQDCDGRNVLHLACIPTDPSIRKESLTDSPHSYRFNVNRLLCCFSESKAIDAQDSEDRTPLHYAAMSTYYDDYNVEVLFQNGADIYVMDAYGKTPLEYALKYGGTNAMECLLKHHRRKKAKKVKSSLKITRDINTADDEGRNILHKAAAFASPEALLVLLETGVDMNARDKIGKTALDYALERSNVESALTILDVLLEKQRKEKLVHTSVAPITKNFYLKDTHSRTMLHHSVIYSKQNVLNLLLSQDMDMNDRDDSGKTPLHYAFQHGNIEAAEKLLEAGASVDLEDANGKTVVHHAAKRSEEKLTNLLVSSKANLNILDNESNSGVYYAVKMRNVAIAEKLVKAGASIEGKDNEGGTVLHLAAYNGDKNLFDLLFKNNANKVEETDKKGNSVLFYAVRGGNGAIAEKLIKAGATADGKNDEGKTVLHLAAENNSDEKLTDLLLRNKAKVSVNDVDDVENSALYYAVSLNKLVIAEKLIEAGARVDEKCAEGKTVLHLAAEKGDEKLIDLLLASNANVNDIDSKGNSVLSYAVRGNMLTIVKKFIKAGARVDKKCAEGKTVLHLATEKGDKKLIDPQVARYWISF